MGTISQSHWFGCWGLSSLEFWHYACSWILHCDTINIYSLTLLHVKAFNSLEQLLKDCTCGFFSSSPCQNRGCPPPFLVFIFQDVLCWRSYAKGIKGKIRPTFLTSPALWYLMKLIPQLKRSSGHEALASKLLPFSAIIDSVSILCFYLLFVQSMHTEFMNHSLLPINSISP